MSQNPGQKLPKRKDLIAQIAPTFLDFDVPGGSQLSHDIVSKAIISHYWMREIGLETAALWTYHMETRLSEIMPKYVEIAKAQEAMGSIFENSNYTENWDVGRDGSKTGDQSEKLTGSILRDTFSAKDYTKNGDLSAKDTLSGSQTDKKTGKSDTSMQATSNGSNSSESKLIGSSEDSGQTSNTKESKEDRTVSGTSSGSTSADEDSTTNVNVATNSQKLYSDTPQNGLESVVAGLYLTNATIESGSQTNATTAHGENSSSTSGETSETSGTTGKETDEGITKTTGSSSQDQTVTGSESSEDSGTSSTTTSSDSSQEINQSIDKSQLSKEIGRQTEDGNIKENSSKDGSRTISESTTRKEVGSRSRGGFVGDKVKTMSDYATLYVSVLQLIIGEVADLFLSIY